jgi:UDP-N-acetylmuramoyl-tripeptide--D-alanyl-D-alanine ligase
MQVLGFDPEAGAVALAQFQAVGGRGARRVLAVRGARAVLLDESYNASAASVRAALSVLRLQPASRRVAVLGDMLELGADGAAEHLGLVNDVAQTVDLLFACGPLTRHLYEALPAAKQGAHAMDSATLAPIVVAALAANDAVLVKGSLGSQMRRVVDALEGAV